VRVLVIKLSALGDFVLALGPFEAIRAHHADARITLLTTAPFAELARASGYFDEVWIDPRAKLHQPLKFLVLARRLRSARFDRAYDLQRTDRSQGYYRALSLGRRLEWNGIARGSSHRYTDPRQHHIHTIERQKEQLKVAGIESVPDGDLSWLDSDIERFDLPDRFALLVAGSAAHRPEKRWPSSAFGALAAALGEAGVTPVLLGGAAEAETLAEVAEQAPSARNLCGETGFADIVALARRAHLAVGNDTGPMHLIAAAGCPALVLFAAASDPDLTAPRGARVMTLQRARLADLPLSDVQAALAELLPDAA
jgi:ADP-heptose:LPS heptosyltransferase